MARWQNALVIARREYVIRVANRMFVVLTVALALVGLGLALTPMLLGLIDDDQPTEIGVAVSSDDPATTLVRQLESSLNGGLATDATYRLVPIDDADAAAEDVAADELEGLLRLDRAGDGDLAFEFLTDLSPTHRTVLAVQSAAQNLAISDRLAERGVTDVGAIFAPPAFATTSTAPDGAPEDDEPDAVSFILVYVLVILTFMAVLTYGSWVASGVAEEKSSRVMELLITAAQPRELLLGKVLGNGAAGLTQYLVIILAALTGFAVQGPLGDALGVGSAVDAGGFGGLTLPVLLVFGAFFVAGFVLYAALYAGLGSMASRQEDVQQIVGPMTLIGMAGYFAAFTAIAVPDAAWVTVLSFVPFFAPYFIPIRLVEGVIAPWELLLSFGFLLVGIWLAIAVAARIYAAGVLLYGQRPSFGTIVRTVILPQRSVTR